jgi:hypothetical protein
MHMEVSVCHTFDFFFNALNFQEVSGVVDPCDSESVIMNKSRHSVQYPQLRNVLRLLLFFSFSFLQTN